jgi:hypothetical protein
MSVLNNCWSIPITFYTHRRFRYPNLSLGRKEALTHDLMIPGGSEEVDIAASLVSLCSRDCTSSLLLCDWQLHDDIVITRTIGGEKANTRVISETYPMWPLR